MKKMLMAACVSAVAAAGISASFAAESNPSIVHRQATYTVVSGHMNSLKSILFLGGEGNAAYHANSIKAAWEHMGNAFPAGSDKGDTRAKPEIWENMEDFQAKGKAAYAATLQLVDAATNGDKAAQVDTFKALGGACKACHKSYREK